MRPIQYYIGILLVLEYAYCLPLAGQVKDKVAREGGGRLEYTEVKTERSTDGENAYRLFQDSRFPKPAGSTGDALYLSLFGFL